MMSSPLRRIAPVLLRTMPMMARKVVVLPAPLRPMRVRSSPSRTSKVMPCRALDSAYQACRLSTARRGAPSRLIDASHIGRHDVGVRGHFGIGAFREHFAVLQNGDAIAQGGDDRQVVLDDEDRASFGGAPDERRDRLDILVS